MTTPAVVDLRTVGFATKACMVCGWRFFTYGGLSEHQAACRPRRRKHGPAGIAVLRENGRRAAAHNNSLRRRCKDCDLVSTPAAVGMHQKATGHTGLADVS